MASTHKLSIITPSIRPKMLDIVFQSLKAQTYTDWEWLPRLSVPREKPDLCKQMNAALNEARGDIILFWQDAIKAKPDALANIVAMHDAAPKNAAFTYPVGKTLDWKNVEWDWRNYWEMGKEMDAHRWEIDFGSVSRETIGDVRFDESFDDGFGWENVLFADTLELRRGVKFYTSHATKVIALDHDKLEPHPYKKKPNADLYAVKKEILKAMVETEREGEALRERAAQLLMRENYGFPEEKP